MDPFCLKSASSNSNFLSQRAAEIEFLPEKHLQKENLSFGIESMTDGEMTIKVLRSGESIVSSVAVLNARISDAIVVKYNYSISS